MASLLNASIGEYRVTESLGAGGMGEVYKAVHTHLGRVIAIKVLSPGLADGAALKRFYGEAGIQASLKHPGVAEYLGFYEYQGRPCILMEYVDGETLAAIIRRRGALPPAQAVGILREMAAVAAHFHAQGVVHRDLKTNNVKINSAGRIKILDFGIARHERADRMTQVGAVIGTPEALAPEQVRGAPATQATDVWQLGVMLYEALVGRLPFTAPTEQEMYARILAAEYPPAGRVEPGVAPSLDKIVARCLQRDPAKRYPSGAELEAALGAWEASDPRPPVAAPPPVSLSTGRPRVAAWAAGGAGAAAVLVAILLALRGGGQPAKPQPSDVTRPRPVPAAPAEFKAVTVDTMDGTAEVFRRGERVGRTPYRIEAPQGQRIDLVLRREGFKDLPLEFEISERHNYTYTMEPTGGR
jgi:eukaryotic-like serine/threonine-protein kinase